MLIPLNQIRQIYHTMLSMALEKESRGCTMYIFVTNDTDSLCALRIFTVSQSFLQPRQPIRTSRSNHHIVSDYFAARRNPLRCDSSLFEYTSTSRNRLHTVHVRGKYHLILRLIFSRPFPALCSSTVVAILTSRKNGSTRASSTSRRTLLTLTDQFFT